MKEISCRVVLLGVHILETNDLPTAGVFDGIAWPREYLLDPDNRIDWADWIQFMENGYRLVGDRERWIEINRAFHLPSRFGVWRMALGPLIETERLFHFFANVLLPLNYSVVAVAIERLGPHRVRLDFSIPEHLTIAESVVWACEGVLSTLPQHAGLPRAKVTLQESGLHRWVFLMELQPSVSLGARLRSWWSGGPAHRSTEAILQQQHAELRLSHAELEQQAQDFRGALDASSDAVAVVRAGRVLYANPALAELFEAADTAELVGSEAERWLAADDLTALRKWAAEGGSGGRREGQLRRSDRPNVYVEISPPRAITWAGQPAVLWMLSDITERRALEHAFARATEREQERIARDIHDSLGQQLTAVALQLRLLERRLGTVDAAAARKTGELAGMVSEATKQARDLAHGLAATEVVRAGLPAALRHLAVATTGLFSMEVQVSAQGEAEAAFAGLPIETVLQLYRAVQEALTNAHRHGRAQRVVVQMAESAAGLALSIEDDGQGLPESTSPARPAGMGLKIMGHRLASVGGTVVLAPRAAGSGVVVSLRLPGIQKQDISATPATVAPEGAAGPAARGTCRGVVVIDDHAMVRAGLVQLLGQTPGFTVLGEAGNRRDALAVCRERRPGVVLCDVQLGEESGVELMRELRALLPASRIVALSMYAEELHGPAARAAGADAFVGKQARPDVLIAALV